MKSLKENSGQNCPDHPLSQETANNLKTQPAI